MEVYKPGLHIISTFAASEKDLCKVNECRQFFEKLISELDLVKVGEVYHSFQNGGFTASVCLTESHVCVHTWPEYAIATFDVFLSSYRRDNGDKARKFYNETLHFFNATEKSCTEIER